MRHVYKKSDSAIKRGDLILSEQPFAFVLSSKEKGNRCDHCLQKCKVLKCSGCQFVYYCGRVCQKDAWGDHKWECANLKRVAPKVIPDGARMLAKIINRLRRGDGYTYKAFYTPTSFRVWKDLMSHYTDLKADKKRMDHFTTVCVVLFEFLSDVSLPNTVDLMGLYGRMVINSFTILDTDINSIGTAIYLASSIIDHSCDPNAVATFDGNTINIRAIKDMPCLDWKQIRISYIDLMKTPYERQMELLENYYFLCQCDRCMDENQLKHVHAAKCRNAQCDNPINIPWKENCILVKKHQKQTDEIGENRVDRKELAYPENSKNKAIQNKDKTEEKEIDIENLDIRQTVGNKENGVHILNGFSDIKEINGTVAKSDSFNCDVCDTNVTDEHIQKFVEAMELSESNLLSMKNNSVAYVDVCKYSLEKQEGILHPLNVMYAQTLDNAFDGLIQVQLWEQACNYAEKLIPCFRFYYGKFHPLLGLLHLKYGKILLYKMNLQEAQIQFQEAEKVLKVTHGDRHPLYKEQLLPLMQQLW